MNLKSILFVSAFALVGAAQAVNIATWTFETSVPTTAGPLTPEVGAGSATGVHTGASTYSTPAGNGSAHSFSSTAWAVNDAYIFQVSTLGLAGITLSFDQTSSGTGPRDFAVSYSTDNSNYFFFANYQVLPNGTAPNAAWNANAATAAYSNSFDLSSITALNNKTSIYLRLYNTSTVSAAGGTVAATGTDRVDNVTIGTAPVPEPSAFAALGLGAVAVLRRRRKA